MVDHRVKLLAEAPPPKSPVGPGTPGQWDEVERCIGTALPEDYKWLIDTYGSGEFCDLLAPFSPFHTAEGSNLLAQIGLVLDHYQRGRPSFPETCPFPTYPEPGGLLPFAGTTNASDMFWLTEGRPDDWTLVIYDWRGGFCYEQYSMGLVEFLAKWVSGQMPESFFGVGNSPGIIRRDPVFCPTDQSRPDDFNPPPPTELW